jgi:hypothetical protein
MLSLLLLQRLASFSGFALADVADEVDGLA